MALQNIFSPEIVQKLGWTLLHFIWQAAVVALLLGTLLAVLRKSSSNIRYIIACTALGLIVALPIITMQMIHVSTPQPTTNIEMPPAPTIVRTQPIYEEISPTVVVKHEEPAQLESNIAVPNIPWKQRAVDKLEPALPYLVIGWLLGVFGLSLWHLGGWAQLQRLKKQMVKRVEVPLQVKLNELSGRLKVKRVVQLLESALVQVPTVVGWLRPVILLPVSALTGLTAEQLEALLAHELAHIRRYDYLVNMLQTVVETLGFYHPSVWWVSHKIRTERENCCDDLAVSISGDRVRYAKALASMEEIRAGRSELAVAATGGSLFGRIRRLVSKESSDSSRAGWIPFVITILLIAIISVPTTIALTAKSKSPEPRQETDVMGNVKPESEEWENIGEIIPADFNDTKLLTEHINLGSIGQDCEGKVFITCILDSAQSSIRRHRFVLVQKNGNILEPSGYTTFGLENKLQEKFSFNTLFSTREIEGFRFQIRPSALTGIDGSLLQLQQVNSATVGQGKPVPSKLAPPGRYAIELDGINDYLLVPDSPSLRLEMPFTVEMWIKTNLPADTSKEYGDWALISKGFYIGTPRAWVTGFGIVFSRYPKDPSKLLIDYVTANNSGTYSQTYGTTSRLKNGKSDWIHLFHVFNREKYKSTPGHPLVIGKFLIPTTRPLMGQIGEIRIWNGARTREQIRRYENAALTGNEPDLAAWWPFEQKEGQLAYDMSGNKNHARLGSSTGADDADPKWIDLEAAPNQAESGDKSQEKTDTQPKAEVFGLDKLDARLDETTKRAYATRKISGLVTTKTGDPEEGVEVRIIPSQSGVSSSDAEGRFSLEYEPRMDAAPETDYYLSARHQARNLAAFQLIDENTKSIGLKLDPAITLTGAVVDTEGRQIADAEVKILIRRANWKGSITYDTTQTDANGLFGFKAISKELPISNVIVTVKGYCQYFVNRVDLYDGEKDIKLKTITLHRANLSVSGTVVDVNDQPISGAVVKVLGGGEPRTDTITDSQGRFKVEKLGRGGIRIIAKRGGDIPLEGFVDSQAGATEVKVKLSEVYKSPQLPKSKVGKSLSEIDHFKTGLDNETLGETAILLCFFDFTQRPSRHCIVQLTERAEELKKKGLTIIAIQSPKVERNSLDGWVVKNGIRFPVRMVQDNEEKTRFDWGIKSLPWPILTDRKHIITDEGFSLEQLDEKLKEKVSNLSIEKGRSSNNLPAKSATQSAENNSIVKVGLSVVEVSSEPKIDSKTTAEIRNILDDKITVPDSPAAADLLRKAARATAPAKDDSTGGKQITQQQFYKLFNLLALQHHLKILMNPTLEVVDGETAKIRSKQDSLEDSIQITPDVLEDGSMIMQVEATLYQRTISQTNEKTSFADKIGFSTRVRLGPGEIGIIGGTQQAGLITKPGKDTKDLEVPAKETLIILKPTIVGTVIPSLVGSKLPVLQELQIAVRPDDLKNRKILLCFWDMNQRPSRNLISELARREKELADKNVAVLLVDTSGIEPAKLKKWLDNRNIPFACGNIKDNARDVLIRWGVQAQPWLILTDQNRVVRTEGFDIEQLDEKPTETTSTTQVETEEAASKAAFEELSVKFSGVLIHWQDMQFTVRGDGSVEVSMNIGPRDKSKYKTAFTLSDEHLAELSGLLQKTNWLTAPGANVQPGYTDATRIDISLTREDKVRSVWCHDRNPEPYLALIIFLKRIQCQEYLLYQMTVPGNLDRRSAFNQVYQQIRAEKSEPASAHPHRILDFSRFVLISINVITHPDDNYYETVAIAIKILGKLKVEQVRQQITDLTTAEQKEQGKTPAATATEYIRTAAIEALTELGGEQARLHIRGMAGNHNSWRLRVNEAIVEGLLKLDRDHCAELLKDMAAKTERASWGLIRLGATGIPAILEMLEVRDSRYMGQIYLIRQYIDNWQKVPKPMDPRVIEAVQRNLDYRLGHSPDWTQYHKELLQLAGAPELPAKNARQIAEEFLAAVKAEDQIALDTITNADGGSWPQRFAKLKELPDLRQLKVTEVYADKDGNIGMAVALDTSREKGTRVSIYLNFLSGSVWRVVNIAIERPEIGDRMTRRFLESHPNAKSVSAGRSSGPGNKNDVQVEGEEKSTIGRIVDGSGQGIARATMNYYQWNPEEKKSINRQTIETGEDGSFKIPFVEPGERCSLSNITAPGFDTREHVMLERRKDGTFYPHDGRITLFRIGSIAGQVYDINGIPLSGAPLSLSTNVQYPGSSIHTKNHIRSITDENGRFVMKNVPPGVHLLYYPWSGPSKAEVEQRIWDAYTKTGERYPSAPIKGVLSGQVIKLREGENIDDAVIDLSKSTCSVAGQVSDSTGRPVTGAKVSLYWTTTGATMSVNGRGYEPVETDQKGRYYLDNLPPGEWHIRAWHELIQGPFETVPIKLTSGKTVQQDFRLHGKLEKQSGETVKEKIPWGEAVEGAQIRLLNATQIWERSDCPHPIVHLQLDARNEGGRFLHLTENGLSWQTEMDGLWYEWVDPRLFSAAPEDKGKTIVTGGGRLLDFNPGNVHDKLTVDIAGEWRQIPDGKQEQFGQRRWTGWAFIEDEYGPELVFQSGPHRLRVAITCPPSRAGVYTPVRLISNPVEFVIKPQVVPGVENGPTRERKQDDTGPGIVKVLPSATIASEDRKTVSNVPKPAKSVAPAGTDKSIVKVGLSVVEVPPGSQVDRETTIMIRNILDDKITIPDSPAAADLLRKAAGATAPVKDESAADKRLTQEEFKTLLDLLVSRGYVKILMNPTLEVVDGETAKIRSKQDSLEDSIQITPDVLEDGSMIMQVEATLYRRTISQTNEKTAFADKIGFSTRVHLGPGEIGIIGGTQQAGLITKPGKDIKDLEAASKETLIILKPTIVGTVIPSLIGSKLPGLQELQIAVRPDDLKNRKILLCFWDMNQRPSRNLISELARREKELADKNVAVLLVDTSGIEPAKLKEWLDNRNIPFICGSIKNDATDVLIRWGVQAQPWLILTDQNRVVRAEGFDIEQLDEELQKSIGSNQVVLKLVDPNSHPVVGAQVGTYVDWSDIAENPPLWFLRSGRNLTAVNVKSDEHGKVTLEANEIFGSSRPAKEIAPITAIDEGRDLVGLREMSRKDLGREVTIMLQPGCRVHGRLTAAAARKRKWDSKSLTVYVHWYAHRPCQYSSEQGRFEFVLPPGKYEVEVYSNNPDTAVILPILIKPGQGDLDLTKYLDGTSTPPPVDIDDIKEIDRTDESRQRQTAAQSEPILAKSVAPAGTDKSIVKVGLSVVEVPPGSQVDRETTIMIRNILDDKITTPDSRAAADLLRKASEATAPVKDESVGDKRLTQKEFKTLFDLLVSRGHVKILMNPTLEVVESQTAQLKTDQSSLEVTVESVKDEHISMQVKADLSSQIAPPKEGKKPMISRRSLSNFVSISSGQSQIIGGMIQRAARPSTEGNAKVSQTPAGELMCIVTASIVAPATNKPVTRVYDIYDLVVAGARISRGTVDVTMDGSGFGMGSHVNIPDQVIVNEAQNIVNLIMRTIDPNSWFQNNPNAVGIITPFPAARPRKLAIYQTLPVHKQIEKFLQSQREQTYTTQISIELRYLCTNAEFLDEIRDSMDIKFTPDTFLDDKQVAALLRASQKKKDIKSLMAPRATVLNNVTTRFNIPSRIFMSFLDYSEPNNLSQQSSPVPINTFCRITPHIEDNKSIIIDFAQDIPGLQERIINDRREMAQPYTEATSITNKRIPNNKTFAFACDIRKSDRDNQAASPAGKKMLIVLIKPTISVQEEMPASEAPVMILHSPRLIGDTAEQSDDTILPKPVTKEMRITNKDQIQIDVKILTASDEFMKYIGLDPNSVANSKGWSDYLVHSSDDSASFVIDQLHADLLLRNVAARMRTHKDIKMFHGPQGLALSGKKFEIHIKDSEHFMLRVGPPDANVFSVEPESESNPIELGTIIRMIPTLTPDGKDIELDFEWEYRRLRGIKEHTGSDGNVQKVPRINIDRMKTPCTIPVGKTLLIAGKKISVQEKKEPNKFELADLPLIGMLFYSPNQVEQTRNLIIMVTPTKYITETKARIKTPPIPPLTDPNDPLVKKLEEKFKRYDEQNRQNSAEKSTKSAGS